MFWRRLNDDEARTPEDRVLEQLSAYLDGELTAAEDAEVESLIARDAAAAELVGDLRLMRSAFGALGEVRAPRSFAIPADAAPSMTPTPIALFRRTEMFMRASAAVAALLFVVAVVNDPGGTPVASPSADLAFGAAETTLSAAESTGATVESGAALQPAEPTAKDESTPSIGATGLAAPDPAGGTAAATDNGGEDDGPASAPAPAAGGVIPDGDAANGGFGGGIDGASGDASQTESARTAEELRPLAPGTELVVDSSEGAGGMALGLGVLTALLATLSALTAWTRRSDGQTR